MSCLLASRFGGTPWAWRRDSQPEEEDWGTCLNLLQEEHDQLEKGTP